MKQFVTVIIEHPVISKSKSSYNSSIVAINKPNGELRICIVYRMLNEASEPLTYPIPKISEILTSLHEMEYISQIDLASAFHQCLVSEESKDKTAFTFNNCRYEWNRVPFGLQGSPAFFSRVINTVLYDLLGTNVLSYMDDIVVFSKTKKGHLEKIEEVLNKLEEGNLKIKVQKCTFFAKAVKFLGYRLTKDGLQMDMERVKSINNMPYPKNKKQVQSLLGVCNYYRPFVRGFLSLIHI